MFCCRVKMYAIFNSNCIFFVVISRLEHQRIADIFVKKGPYLKMYSTYIKEFDKNVALLDEQCKKNAGFASVVKDFEVLYSFLRYILFCDFLAVVILHWALESVHNLFVFWWWSFFLQSWLKTGRRQEAFWITQCFRFRLFWMQTQDN